MKSKYFTKRAYSENDDYKKHLSRLTSLDEKTLLLLPRAVCQLFGATTESQKNELRAEISDKNGIEESVLISNNNIIKHFLTMLSPSGDAAEDDFDDIATDAIELDLIPKESKSSFTRLLKICKEVAHDEYHYLKKKDMYVTTGVPTIASLTVTVSMRAIFDDPFKPGQNIQNYNPVCEGIAPVGNISLQVSSDSPVKNIYFQVTPQELDVLIGHLTAAKKEIETMIDYIGLTE